jgi:hypothetical protein
VVELREPTRNLVADATVSTRYQGDALYLQSEQLQSQPESQQSQSHAIETSFRHVHLSRIY